MNYVLVTGAYGGMGKATVEKLVEKGFVVFAIDKTVGERTENIIPIQVDVTDISSVKSCFEKVKEITSNLFAIIHFAGVYKLDSLIEVDENDFENLIKVNFLGAFYVNKIFSPLLFNGSRIIITTSELAPLDPLPFTGMYAISKTALDRYAYSLRMELQLLGIHVSVIRAGAVSTNMLGVSIDALDKFCKKTERYEYNAKRFYKIVSSIEAKSVKTEKLANKTLKILSRKKPKFSYSLNRNKLLLLLNFLPQKIQFAIIKKILINKKKYK